MSEAERLADYCEELAKEIDHSHFTHDLLEAAAELRRLSAELEGHKAARTAYASEFPLNGEGEPDVGSIHQNIRALKAELAALKAAMGEPVGRLESDGFAGYVFIPQVPGDWSMLGKYLYAIPKEKP